VGWRGCFGSNGGIGSMLGISDRDEVGERNLRLGENMKSIDMQLV
jgi:hypothetical protein